VPLITSLKKKPETHNQKCFSLTDLAKSFEGLNSSLTQSPSENCYCRDTLEIRILLRTTGSKGVNFKLPHYCIQELILLCVPLHCTGGAVVLIFVTLVVSVKTLCPEVLPSNSNEKISMLVGFYDKQQMLQPIQRT